MRTLILSLVCLLPLCAQADMGDRLVREAPGLDRQVASRAMKAVRCSAGHGKQPGMLIVVDMAKPASSKRLYAFDMKTNKLVTSALVAHGKGSDPDFTGRAQKFGNEVNSGMTSLGLYKVAESYEGKHGLSRRLDGLMRGWNDRARQRAVVIHSSNYVRPGSVGRSLGCPAVQRETLDLLEAQGLGNALLYIDGPDSNLGKAVADCKASYKYQPTSYPKPRPAHVKVKEPLPFTWGSLSCEMPWSAHESAL